jgi:homoserine O-acetyltransferase/O-succinyltransferase
MIHRFSLGAVMLGLAACHAGPVPASPEPAAPARAVVADTVSALPLQHHDAKYENYRFRDGKTIPELRIHYSTFGTPQRDAAGKITNAVLVLHWTSASSAAVQTPEYVSSLYAPGKPLDPAKYYLVFIDNVGHGRSSKPSDGLHARFPKYGYRDMVDLQHRVVTEALGIAHLHAIVGMSMGGMHAWLWAENYPDEVDGILPVVSLPTRIAGRNLVWRRIVARAIRTDPEWKGGDYTHPPRGWVEAFPLFRMMLDGVPHLQATIPDRAAAAGFLQAASAVAATMDANDVLYSLESSEDYDPEPALARVRAKVLLLNFGDDEFNPVALHTLERLTPKVASARFVVQPGTDSSYGHLTQAHPGLWADHVGELMRDLDTPKKEP